MRNFTIEARRWFQKSYGNTYHSVRVYDESGKLIGENLFEYGYGDQWELTSNKLIQEYFDSTGEYANDTPFYKATSSVTDVERKKDL